MSGGLPRSRIGARQGGGSPKPRPRTAAKNKPSISSTFPLNMLYVYLTEGCNLACRHCWIAPKFQSGANVWPSLPFSLFRDVVLQAKRLGLSSVKLTGGEPLLHPEISRILEFIRSQDLGCTIETNGILCSPELAQQIAQHKAAFVSVSLDGADPETNDWVRGVAGSFEATVLGLRRLVEVGLKPQIIMTLLRRNKGQVEAVVRLAESLGAGSVKFNILMPCARGEDLYGRGEALSIEDLVALGAWVETDLAPRSAVRLIYHHPAAFAPLGKIYGDRGDGCSRCGIHGILGVLADGGYALCGIGEQVPELVFGHAERDRLKDVWTNHPVLKAIREGLPRDLEGVCRECLMKELCLGSCVAQNYYSRRSLFAPFWYCEEARSRGLFPSSRLLRTAP